MTFMSEFFGLVCAVEEFSVEELYSNYTEDELEQEVYDQYVEYVFQGVHDAIEYCLKTPLYTIKFENCFDRLFLIDRDNIITKCVK